jgi:hypothetical protein
MLTHCSACSRYRPIVQEMIGKCIFPVIVDPNKPSAAGNHSQTPDKTQAIPDSAAIVDHLWKQYGDKSTPIGISSPMFLSTPVIFRPLPAMGVLVTPSKLPNIPLELYSYEHEPKCRLIREVSANIEKSHVNCKWLMRAC